MSEILRGMTREQALGCVLHGKDNPASGFFVHGKTVCMYVADLFPGKSGVYVDEFKAAINAYFDEQEKPKWKMPELRRACGVGYHVMEDFYNLPIDIDAEIARTNARRKIEAFIRENGGSGDCFIWFNDSDSVFCVSTTSVNRIGAIMCATRDLAQAVIELFPDELRLLAGVT